MAFESFLTCKVVIVVLELNFKYKKKLSLRRAFFGGCTALFAGFFHFFFVYNAVFGDVELALFNR
jgi:hypothetical protein